MKLKKLKQIIKETLKEQAHWFGANVGSDYNPPVNDSGEIIPGDFIFFGGSCSACTSQPYAYECYNPDSPLLFNSINECESSCKQVDFEYGGECGQQFLAPAPGNENSWAPWLAARWNNFYNGNKGCYTLGAIMNYSMNQITPTESCPAIYEGYGGGKPNGGQCFNLIQVKRKYAKAQWAECLKTGSCSNNPQNGC